MASLLKNNTNTINDLLTTISNLPNALTLDTTLTQSGQAADAKIVGDALAEKQPIGDYALKSDIPTVPAWAKEANPPTYTATDVGADVAGSANAALESAKDYTDSAISTIKPMTNAEVDAIIEAAGLILPSSEEVYF